MNDLAKKKLIRWLIAVVIVVSAAAIFTSWRLNNPPFDMEEMPFMQALSDGCFIVGLFCTGMGILMWISTTGVLDMIGYGFKSLLYLFTPMQKDRDEGGFYEYKLQKKQKKKGVPFEYLWLGIGMIVLSFIFVLFI